MKKTTKSTKVRHSLIFREKAYEKNANHSQISPTQQKVDLNF